MSERIVVSCRLAHEQAAHAPGSGAAHRAPSGASPLAAMGYLERARALTRRAEALGATLAAWSAETLAFAWDVDSIEEAVSFVTELNAGAGADADETKSPDGETERPTLPRWASGVAEGPMEPLAETEAGGGRADLAWGAPLVAAVVLARVAEPGEVLVDASVVALANGKMCVLGSRVATDAGRRVRGARLDVRQPWRADAAKSLSRVVKPPLIGRPDPHLLLQQVGVVHLLRADPGFGGSRMLAEVAARVAPSPCLLVMPSGASVEPLGALRRALVRALASSPAPKDDVLGPQLDMFLGGIGASIEVAASLVEAWLKTAPEGAPGALLIDDAGEVDAESLEACAQLVAWARVPLYVTVRVDATDALPSALFDLPRGLEVDLEPLGRPDAEALARACTGGAMTALAAKRWARRGTFSPLGILEAIQCGITTGDLAWIGDRASPRTRASGMGKGHGPAYWIAKRAKKTAPNERGVLAAVALFGGEVSLDNAERALHAVDAPIQVREEAGKLVRARWLVPTEPGWVALPTRTHRDTIAELLDEEPRRALHRAIAEVLEQSEGELGCAEAAHHAAKAGDGERGARLALRAARAASAAGMTKSANRLLTLARLADPKCEPQTRRQLISSLPPPPAPPPGGKAAAPGGVPPIPPPPPTAKTIDVAPTERITALTAEAAARILESHHEIEPPPRSEPRTLVDAPAARAPAPERRSPLPPPVPGSSGKMRAADAVRDAGAPPPPRTIPPPLPPRAADSEARPSRARAAPPSAALPPPVPPPVRPPAPRAIPSVPALPSVRPPPPPSRPRDEPSERTILGVPSPSGAMLAAPRYVAPAPPGSAAATGASPAGRTAWSSPDPSEPAADEDRTLIGVGRPAAPQAIARAPEIAPPSELATPPGEDAVAGRLTELARMALVGGDAGALERWSEGLRATGEHDRFAERMEAMARLSRGQVGDALRVLRKAREQAEEGTRAQASLALGVALAAAGRAEEALLEGLDALARAREKHDGKGASACLAFLAKLFHTQQKDAESELLRAAATRG